MKTCIDCKVAPATIKDVCEDCFETRLKIALDGDVDYPTEEEE